MSWARLDEYQLRRAIRCVVGAALLLVAGLGVQTPHGGALAQGADVVVTIDEIDGSDYATIRLRVGVRDRTGVPIPGLAPGNFEIIEDGATAYAPSSVVMESTPSVQVSLAIVVDTYRTLAGRPIEAAQLATTELLDDLLGSGDSDNRAAFVGIHKGISTDPQVVAEDYEVPFTSDRNRLLNVVNFIHERMESEPGTPLYDAVVKAVRMAAATEQIGHRAVIVMTDGEDRTSISADSDTIQTAISQRTPVFTIGLSNSRLNEQYLRRLADQTGGTYQAAESPEAFTSQFASVLTSLRTHYVLAYEAQLPADGLPHSLLVYVRTPTGAEGFAEDRFVSPGEPPAPTALGGQAAEELTGSATPVLTATPVPDPAATAEGGTMDAIAGFVQDNLLLSILIVAALALLLLILIVIGFILIKRRMEEEEVVPSVPEVPFAPEPVDGRQGGYGTPTEPDASTDWAAERYAPVSDRAAGGAPAPPTQADDGASYEAFGDRTTTPRPPSEPALAQPPAYVRPPVRSGGGAPGGTQILDRGPRLPAVGLLIDPKWPGRRFDIDRRVVSIGRAGDNDVVIDDATISRQHATIKWEDNAFHLYDLGSSNGTFLGDRQVRDPVALEDGATVRFGAVELVFKLVPLSA